MRPFSLVSGVDLLQSVFCEIETHSRLAPHVPIHAQEGKGKLCSKGGGGWGGRGGVEWRAGWSGGRGGGGGGWGGGGK